MAVVTVVSDAVVIVTDVIDAVAVMTVVSDALAAVTDVRDAVAIVTVVSDAVAVVTVVSDAVAIVSATGSWRCSTLCVCCHSASSTSSLIGSLAGECCSPSLAAGSGKQTPFFFRFHTLHHNSSSYSGSLQLLELLEVSRNLVDAPGKFYN